MKFTVLQLRSIVKHAKTGLQSVLDTVDGIGSKRKTRLLRTFGSIKKMKEASVADLQQAGLPEKVAHNLQQALLDNY